MYGLLKQLLFTFPPETAHNITLSGIHYVSKLGLRLSNPIPEEQGVEVWGIHFPNRVGLAAGLDKNGIVGCNWRTFGFGFAEIGTVTPVAQDGNPKPRLFRLKKDESIINRMGFNNKGVEFMVENLVKQTECSAFPIGGNIGKNKSTPNDRAYEDYLICLKKLIPHVSYITVNISSPNTPGLRDLQTKSEVKFLMEHLIRERNSLGYRKKPILVKIAPDLDSNAHIALIEGAIEGGADGIISCNTTLSRDGLLTMASKIATVGAGGLSGKALFNKSLFMLNQTVKITEGKIPVIGVGGIHSLESAKAMFDAGAILIQLYTGFVYGGPPLVKDIVRGIRDIK
jgi:dihydroorotate dehydrogenase